MQCDITKKGTNNQSKFFCCYQSAVISTLTFSQWVPASLLCFALRWWKAKLEQKCLSFAKSSRICLPPESSKLGAKGTKRHKEKEAKMLSKQRAENSNSIHFVVVFNGPCVYYGELRKPGGQMLRENVRIETILRLSNKHLFQWLKSSKCQHRWLSRNYFSKETWNWVKNFWVFLRFLARLFGSLE